MRRKPTLYPHSLFNHVNDPASVARGIDYVTRHLGNGDLRPVIGRVFRWDQALEAFDYLAEHRHSGKIVVEVDHH